MKLLFFFYGFAIVYNCFSETFPAGGNNIRGIVQDSSLQTHHAAFLPNGTIPGTNARSIQQAIDELLVSRKYKPREVGVVIRDLDTDSLLVGINADSLYNPASVAKLLTAALAFETFGSNYVGKTNVFADRNPTRDSGSIEGNIYIQGAADPGFTAERLWLFVEQLYHQGIRAIQGNLVIDNFLLDSISIGPGFDEDTTSRSYQPLIGGLGVNANSISVFLRPGVRVKSPVSVDLFPEIDGIKVENSATTVAGKKSTIDVGTRDDSGETVVIVKGTMGIDDRGDYVYRKVWQTWKPFGGALKSLFAKRGIELRGEIVQGRIPAKLVKTEPLFSFVSLPLSQSVNDMFKYSLNYNAELLFKMFSAKGATVGGSWEESQKIASAWWVSKNLPGTPAIKNGSGMGKVNRFTPAQLVSLLAYVRTQKTYWPDYLSALSVAGIDGTLKSRFPRSELKGIVRAKTGTLNRYGVSTLAGYVLLPDRTLGFAIFCATTGKEQYDNWMIQEQILEKVVGMVKQAIPTMQR